MSEGNFEAKVHARRETRDGVYITLSVNPADLTADLAMLRVGSSLIIGWVEVVDTTVQPIELGPVAQPIEQQSSKLSGAGSNPAGATKERRKFSDLPLSQQAAMRCGDKSFQEYMCHYFWNTQVTELTEDYTTFLVKNHLDIESRRELDEEKNMAAREAWFGLEAKYQAWRTDQQYSEARHG